MKVQEVIDDVRYRLGDVDKSGWSDDRLLALINAGQRDLCRRASVYRRKVLIDLANYQAIYTLPDDCYNITRIERGGEQLPIYSREDCEKVAIPHPSYAVKSNLNRSQIELEPVPTEVSTYDDYVEGTTVLPGIQIGNFKTTGVASGTRDPSVLAPTTGVVAGIHDLIACNPKTSYGELADIGVNSATTLQMSPTGVLVGQADIKPQVGSYGFLESIGTEPVVGTYGICTHASFLDNFITVYYDAVPPAISWLTGTLFIEDLWLPAMVHYVVGMARQDDNDESNYKIGEAELVKYEAEVLKARKITAKSYNSQIGVVRETIYRRF